MISDFQEKANGGGANTANGGANSAKTPAGRLTELEKSLRAKQQLSEKGVSQKLDQEGVKIGAEQNARMNAELNARLTGTFQVPDPNKGRSELDSNGGI
jgi:hypothetical protein